MKRIWGSHFPFPFLGARNSAQGEISMEDSDSLCGARRWLATITWSFGLPDADWSEPNFKWTPIAGNVNYCERPPCYAFYFDAAFMRFELKLRLTEKRSIETSHEVCSAFCDRNESAAIMQFVQKWGASRTEENLINPENPWYGSEDRLVWFCNFF